MSSAYYHQRWEQSISDLLQCTEQENQPLEQNRNEKGITYKRTDYQWFQYYGQLYLRYVQAYRKLEDSYDQTVHPQKRVLMRQMLENTIIRMCEVKQNLIKYSSHTNFIQSDYVNVDQILMEMKLTPKSLRVPIPRYYQEKESERDKLIDSLIERMKIPEEIEVFNDAVTLETNFETLIRIIQKLQRGRQSIVRGLEAAKLKNKPHRQRSPEIENEENDRAIVLQKYWRAFLGRRQLAKMREEELKFLGIHKEQIDKSLVSKADEQRKKMKEIQKTNKKKFEEQKINIKANIQRTEQNVIKSKMQDERRKWINKFLQIHQFSDLPTNINDFYKMKKKQGEQEGQNEKLKDKKSKQDSKGKGKKNEVEKFIDEHTALGPTQAVLNIQKSVQSYSDSWGTRDCTQVEEQFFDTDIARQEIRPEVEGELQKIVDSLISLELDCMRVKYGIKKKKQKKKKAKKKKQPKVKIPQGLGKRDPEELLKDLFDSNIAKVLKKARMSDYIGEHNPLTYMIQKTATTLPDPSLSQIRNIVCQYIGIPLGNENAKKKLEKWNWFYFYGGMGTGKTFMIRALQKQVNALVFDISPQTIKYQFSQKSQLTRLIWSVIICAKHFQPAIVLIDDFETIFPGPAKGKKKDAVVNFGPKMKKVIVDMKKNKLWNKNDRIAVVCCSNKPYDGSLKEAKKLFDKKIYFPYPNYAARKLMIKTFILEKIGKEILNFPYDTFAQVTQGFTPGSFLKCIEKVLTVPRIQRIKDEPIKMSQFITPLANTPCVFAQQFDKMQKFTEDINGFKEKKEQKNSGKQSQNKKDSKKK